MITAYAPIPYIPTSTTVTKTLRVDGNRTDSYTEEGSNPRPYKTIQAAIDAAIPTTVVIIEPATYNEDVVLRSGVHLKSRLNAGFYGGGLITGKMTYSPGAGFTVIAGLHVLNTSDHAFDFIGADAIKLRALNCKFETDSPGAHHALHVTNPNPDSEIRVDNTLFQVLDSSGGARCVDVENTCAGSIGFHNTNVRISDDIDQIAMSLGGTLSFWQTLGDIKGRAIVADAASAIVSMLALYSSTQPCITTNSAGATVISSALLSTAASPAVDGAGVFGYSGVSYLSTGSGFAAALNGGAGPDAGALELESGLNIAYDNTMSGLVATRVKTAIDELKAFHP